MRRYLTDPVTRSVASATAQVETMEHHVLLVDTAAKPRVVSEIAARDGRTILFVRTKHGVDRLVKMLRRDGIDAGALHGGKAQNARNRAIAEFKDGQTPVLVATDVAARGIHVDDVSLVVHVDPPADPKDYLHRAGRTARAGDSGTVVTLVTPPERRDVDRLTRLAGRPGHQHRGRRRATPRWRGSPAPGRRPACRSSSRPSPRRTRAAVAAVPAARAWPPAAAGRPVARAPVPVRGDGTTRPEGAAARHGDHRLGTCRGTVIAAVGHPAPVIIAVGVPGLVIADLGRPAPCDRWFGTSRGP